MIRVFLIKLILICIQSWFLFDFCIVKMQHLSAHVWISLFRDLSIIGTVVSIGIVIFSIKKAYLYFQLYRVHCTIRRIWTKSSFLSPVKISQYNIVLYYAFSWFFYSVFPSKLWSTNEIINMRKSFHSRFYRCFYHHHPNLH